MLSNLIKASEKLINLFDSFVKTRNEVQMGAASKLRTNEFFEQRGGGLITQPAVFHLLGFSASWLLCPRGLFHAGKMAGKTRWTQKRA